jgi:hypothetical protein
MSYLKQKFKKINCDMCTGLVSLIIAMHIIIALIVIGVNQYNKIQQTKKPEITNGKHK